jgi:hypothetical protein
MAMMFSGLAEISKLTGLGLGGVQFDSVAIGTDATAVAQTQTALGAEIATGGGARKSGADVTASLVTKNSADDTIRFVTTYAFTNSFSVNELGVFNDPAAGVMLLRQVFDAPLNVVSQDALELTIDVTASDEIVSALSVLTFGGITEGNKLIATDLTPVSGRITSIALGRSNIALDQNQTALGDEIIPTDGLGLGRTEEVVGPTVSLATTSTTDDTVVVDSTWDVLGTVAVNETGTFTDANPDSGVLFVRYRFADPLNLIATDRFRMIMRLVQTSLAP